MWGDVCVKLLRVSGSVCVGDVVCSCTVFVGVPCDCVVLCVVVNVFVGWCYT
jgi:hypothetical protein